MTCGAPLIVVVVTGGVTVGVVCPDDDRLCGFCGGSGSGLRCCC